METLRLLFWLKWKLMWRSFLRTPSMAVGVLLAVVAFLPISLGAALGCWVGFRHLEAPLNEHLLRGVLLGIYLVWLGLPIIGHALNDSYDLTRLFVYPVSFRRLFTGAVLGSVIDFPVLLALPTLLAVLIGFGTGAGAFALALVGSALFLFHTLSLSQAILLASAGLLRSRRFRDVAIVIVPLLWLLYYAATQLLARNLIHVDWMRFLGSRAWAGISLAPPGLAARAIAAGSRGEWPAALGFLLSLGVVTFGTLALAAWVVERLYAGEEVSIVPRMREPASAKKGAPRRARAETPGLLSRLHLPGVVDAIADKEAKYLVREPYFKVILMNLVYALMVAVFLFLRGPRGQMTNSLGPAVLWGVTGWMLFSQSGLAFNMLGIEGGAASVLFLFPASRRQMLLGKNLAVFTALSVVHVAFLLLLAAVAGALALFPAVFCWMELGLLILVAAGNLMSVWFPFRVGMRRGRAHVSASQGCGYGFLYLAAMGGVALLALPALAGLLVPTYWIPRLWYALTVPLAIAYTLGLYLGSLRLGEALLLQREAEVIARLAGEGET